ncbi:MAG TPA: hypothetical protein VF899_10430 [Pyrinomonadaceae bacterium]
MPARLVTTDHVVQLKPEGWRPMPGKSIRGRAIVVQLQYETKGFAAPPDEPERLRIDIRLKFH